MSLLGLSYPPFNIYSLRKALCYVLVIVLPRLLMLPWSSFHKFEVSLPIADLHAAFRNRVLDLEQSEDSECEMFAEQEENYTEFEKADRLSSRYQTQSDIFREEIPIAYLYPATT
ncbi:hypothetical protein CI15_20720 [Paraburkholderia monticola]|uniref:Uncharacterized protein n=2 Tax=Paraburkholderia monticola TaxID=1399968 RepID=A0A149PKL7_9BURK|nr:hypothetical protein CI15_20720 [Paraburkholderia monticola]